MNPIEQLIERQERESRHQIPGMRIAALCVLAVILACMVVVLFHLQPPARTILMIIPTLSAGWWFFVLGRSHARRKAWRKSVE